MTCRNLQTKFVFDRSILSIPSKTRSMPAGYWYWRAIALHYFKSYPNAQIVTVVDRSKSVNTTRYIPMPQEVLCVPSTSGKYGKSSIIRIGDKCLN